MNTKNPFEQLNEDLYYLYHFLASVISPNERSNAAKALITRLPIDIKS